MKKIILAFPGQGSQYVGMGKDFLQTRLENYYKKADEVLGFSLSSLCYEGPIEELKLTENTQPAILTHSIALYDQVQSILEEKGIIPSAVMGHSVGEYSALVAAGALSFEDALLSVNLRGKYMQESVPVGVGKMFACLRISQEEVSLACKEVSKEGHIVVAANINDPQQTVISGHAKACEEVVSMLKEKESRFRAMELQVSAPFHSPLMKPAREKLENHFQSIKFRPNVLPYIANIDAVEYSAQTDPEIIKSNLVKQVDGSVLWLQSLQKIKQTEDLIFIEVGPGKALKGMIKKVHPEAKIFSADVNSDMDELKNIL